MWEIRILDSVEVDGTKPAWRFDVIEIRSLIEITKHYCETLWDRNCETL